MKMEASLLVELPVAPQSYQPTPEALIRVVKRSRQVLARAMAEEQTHTDYTRFVRQDGPWVRSANLVTDIQLESGRSTGDLLQSVAENGIGDDESDPAAPCHTLDVAGVTWPDTWDDAAAVGAGYEAIDRQTFVLQNYRVRQARDVGQGSQGKSGPHAGLSLLPARSLYAKLPRYFAAMATDGHGANGSQAEQFAQAWIDRLDETRLDLVVARLDGELVGSAGVLVLGGDGVIDPAFVLPKARGGGAARALMHAVIDHCSRAQLERVLLDRGVGCSSLPFYKRMGFVQFGTYRRYRKRSVDDQTSRPRPTPR